MTKPNKNELTILPDNITELSKQERDDQIFYLYLVKGVKQIDLAKHYGLVQSRISAIIDKYKQNQNYKDRAISVWEKDISIQCRRKASQIVDSIKPDGMPDGSKAQSAGILIDKARLIDKEVGQIIAYADITREIKDLEAEEVELDRQLGIYK